MVKRYMRQAFPPKNKQEVSKEPWHHHEEPIEQWSYQCLTNAVAIKLINIVLLVPLVIVVFHPILVLYFSILLSLERLREQNFGQNGGDAKKTNLKPGLIVFYLLAFAQGVLYLIWYILNAGNTPAAKIVATKYRFSGEWGWDSVSQYIHDTKFKCLKDLSSTKGRNLVTYASGLLDSDYKEDYLTGARILDSFIRNKKPPMQELLIRSSKKRIQKLLMMLAWTGPDDQEIRDLAATIVADVAGDISIAQFPGTLESVLSLLMASESKPVLFCPWSQETDRTLQSSPAGVVDPHDRQHQLIKQGLIILEKLTQDRNNCIQILKGEADLLIDRLLWICSRPPIQHKEQLAWVNILELSFTVLAQLASLQEQHAAPLRRKISAKLDTELISHHYANLPSVQKRVIDTFLQVFAADNTDLTRGGRKEFFLDVTLELFLSGKVTEQEGKYSSARSEVHEKAGEALLALSVNSMDCKYMSKMHEWPRNLSRDAT